TASSYNKSLLFQYFGDKLGLYTEVVRRADVEMNEMMVRVLVPLLEDETITSNVYKFKTLLETVATVVFDYLVERPRFMRIMLWEMAENWQTYARIASQFNTDDIDLFERLLRKAHDAGLLRSDFAPVIQLSSLVQICLSYLAFLPLYQML